MTHKKIINQCLFYSSDSAEFLFNVLRDPCLYTAGTPVLVVCNKQDLGIQAKGAGVIERELAKEIGLLRVTKSRLLEVTCSLH
jgi:hypothetical protein